MSSLTENVHVLFNNQLNLILTLILTEFQCHKLIKIQNLKF